MNSDRKTVFILGAGCSAGAVPGGPGFPVASEFLTALDVFGNCLGGSDKRCLRKCVEETVELLRVEHAQTVDALVARLATDARDSSKGLTRQERQQRDRQIQNAKIATAALFLHLERNAKLTGLPRYHNFLAELFGNSVFWNQASQRSGSSVLTFNYDRLFEMAFVSRFKPDIEHNELYGKSLLNSGLDSDGGTEIEFDPKRFAFLKMHGSVGIRMRNAQVPNVSELEPHYYTRLDGIAGGDLPPINDDLFFANASNPSPFERDPTPLIVFPHEKPFVRDGSNKLLPFRKYIQGVWQEARRLLGEATEVWAIGYSFAPIDREDVLELLRSAKKCERLVVQNQPGTAENTCRYLRWRWIEPAGLDLKVEPFPQPF